MSVGVIVGFVAGLAAAVTVGILTSLLTKEAEGWIDALPGWLLRLAQRRVPPSNRGTLYDEWAAELHIVLHGMEARPLSRLLFGIRYAVGLLLAARRVADELGPAREEEWRGGYHLHVEQQRAVAEALASPDALAILGPPGAGKTTVIIEIICRLLLRGERVLFVAPTHAAVDAVLRRVGDADGVSALRLSSAPDRVAEDLRRFLPRRNGSKDRHKWGAANLICSTTTGLTGDYLKSVDSDALILDDASQVIGDEFPVAAIRARRWILAGDENQLPLAIPGRAQRIWRRLYLRTRHKFR